MKSFVLALFLLLLVGCTRVIEEPVYKVKFETFSGSAVESIWVETNSPLMEPNTELPCHSFRGWYQDRNHTIPWNFYEDKVYEPLTLYAKWEDNSSIPVEISYLVQNPATTSPSTFKEHVKSVVSCPYTLESPHYTPNLEGHTFDRWYLDESFTEVAQFPIELDSSMTLFGRFKPRE